MHTREEWIDTETAVRYTGRSERTLQRWRIRGLVKAGKRHGQRVYARRSLEVAMLVADKRQATSRFDGSKPGPGCKGKHLEAVGQIMIQFE